MTNRRTSANGSPGQFEFQVQATDPRDRVDRLVVDLLARVGRATARAEVQRWIAEGGVLVNGKPTRRSASVPAGATLQVRIVEPPRSEATADPTVPVAAVYADDDLIVVNKPAGLVVHPARGHQQRTLVHGLLAYGGFEAAPVDSRDPEGHLRPGIVHRLDKDTSGLLVVAKSAAAREGLKEQFAGHSVERSYLAIVVGQPQPASYDTPYGRHPRSRVRFTSRLAPDRAGAKRAITHLQPLEQFADAALVRCRLDTGRTHQIRVHLAEQAQTPVLGDSLYGPKPRDPELRRLAAELGRQALHAQVLGFVHPVTGQPMRWECPIPADMERALASLRRRMAP